MEYTLITGDRNQFELAIELVFTASESEHALQIPYWRPGRYEGGNFPAKYIDLRVFSGQNRMKAQKVNPNRWILKTKPGAEIKVTYRYYASELTAGNTYFNDDFLLVNPVNSFLYVPGREGEGTLRLELPENWTAKTSLKCIDEKGCLYSFSDIQELLDSPVLAAPEINTLAYNISDIPFFVHFGGVELPNRAEVERDFIAFTKEQIRHFGEFPVSEYHFINILLPHKAYHGVEHEKSTVIIYGPAESLTSRESYCAFLGVSSHELYHTWNVKSLRPEEWTPYNYEGPGFSRLGYVVEGVTTYMGDWMLWNSRVFSDGEFLDRLTAHVQRHMDNEGRNHISLADASVDTWVDGYVRGTPRRKVSIYGEGALLALVCDLWLVKSSNGISGINDFMCIMHRKYGWKRGFTEDDYWRELQSIQSLNWMQLKSDVVDDSGKLINYVEEALEWLGMKIKVTKSTKFWEREWGMSIAKQNGRFVVSGVRSGSAAEKAGVWFDQEIQAINGMEPDAFLSGELNFDEAENTLLVKSDYKIKELKVRADVAKGLDKYKIIRADERIDLFEKWKNAQALHNSAQ
ncbi:MAG: hypothetical protein ABR574_06310 [Cryomorphaceae bacterium]|nr:hypothetical protein [Flavobacteriales bacterium]